MIELFSLNLTIFLIIELILQLACFKTLTLFNSIMILTLTVIITVIFTFFLSLIKKKKVRNIIMILVWSLLMIECGMELVYYKIYESFFNLSGISFVGAIKDGFDKVLLTIGQNIIPISLLILMIVGISLYVKKKSSQIDSTLNKTDALVLGILLLVCTLYVNVNVNYIGKAEQFSYYKLLNKINMPTMNVQSFGMVSSTAISLHRTVFGFTQEIDESEDIFTNRKTALADDVNIKYNIDESIDLSTLSQNETNGEIVKIHNYFNEQTPTSQNKYTGIFKDKNVIFILAESFDEAAIDKNLTPTLYKLKNEGIIFNNYFAPKYPASTADGEYMLEWGTLPIIGENYSLIDMVYNTNPYILPRKLKEEGYSTYVYHNYSGYYNRRKQYFSTLNFDGYRYCGEGINTKCENFHGSDLDMMDQTIDDFINKDKFFSYFITLSGHGSYDESNFIAQKHLYKLSGTNYPYSLKYYIAANIEFDLAMNKLITRLKEANKLDDTVIIISSDHTPYYLTSYDLNANSPVNRDSKFDRNRGSLIIYNSTLEGTHVSDKYAMNIDVLPTILNMLGIKYDSRLIIGKDIMAVNNEGVVILPDRSWVTNVGSFDTSTGKFIKFTENVDEKYVSKLCQEVNEKYTISVNMQYNDYYKYVFK